MTAIVEEKFEIIRRLLPLDRDMIDFFENIYTLEAVIAFCNRDAEHGIPVESPGQGGGTVDGGSSDDDELPAQGNPFDSAYMYLAWTIANATGHEVIASLLTFARSRDDHKARNGFQRAFVEAMIVLYQSGNWDKARELLDTARDDQIKEVSDGKYFPLLQEDCDHFSKKVIKEFGKLGEAIKKDKKQVEFIKSVATCYLIHARKYLARSVARQPNPVDAREMAYGLAILLLGLDAL